MVPDRAQLAGALRRLPGADALLDATADLSGVHLVGGAVRDLMLGGRPIDLDIVVEGDAAAVGRTLVARLGGRLVRAHERFGTATLILPGGRRVDFARARAESYPAPGALPIVRPASLAEDLGRRDFTVNALAVALDATHGGTLTATAGALDDLAARRLRVLHPASFRDDPTRLLRLARYAGRLDFAVDPDTARLARDAVAAGALGTVSAGRIGAELRLTLGEDRALEALARADELGLLGALGPGLRIDRGLAERALALLPADGRRDLLLLATLLLDAPPASVGPWLTALETERADAAVVRAAATAAAPLARALASSAGRPSAVRAAVAGAPLEAVALAGALGSAEVARWWLNEGRAVALEIGGEDLVAAGVAPGPAIGRGLRAALDRKLDGELAAGRDAELAAALRAAR